MTIWDSDIPKPGVLVSAEDSLEKRAVAELAMFATAWVTLHEVRHIQHQQDDTSATWGSKEERHAEELSCDEFATRFITEKVDAYSEESGYSNDNVMLKRKIGIYPALFALTLLGKDNWSKTDWHPAVQLRLDAVFKLLGESTVDPALAIAVGAFEVLKLVCPLAPVIHFVS